MFPTTVHLRLREVKIYLETEFGTSRGRKSEREQSGRVHEEASSLVYVRFSPDTICQEDIRGRREDRERDE